MSEDAKQSLRSLLSLSSNDWSLTPEHTRLYGIIIGWNDECYEEHVKNFGWTKADCDRLAALHESFNRLCDPLGRG